MPTIFVIPAQGRQVRDPRKVFFDLPSEGREVQDSPYWRRRIKEGDVTVKKNQPAQASQAKRTAKEE
jgi:hypothetical protein